MFVSVIVNVPASKVDKLFEYKVPDELEPFIEVGERIKIPFGDANRVIHGFIIDVHKEPLYDKEIKEIIEIPDLKPIINIEQLTTARFIKDTCFSPLVRILNLMIPTGLRMKTFKYLVVNDLMKVDGGLASALEGKNKVLIDKKILAYSSQIQKEIKLGNAFITYDADDRDHQVYQKVYSLNEFSENSFINNPKNYDLIDQINKLIKNYQYEKKELNELKFSDYQINRLVKNNILIVEKVLKSRIKDKNYMIDDYYYKNNIEKLSARFYLEFNKTENLNKPFLFVPKNDRQIIQGIGGIIIDNIKNHKKTIVMVPDILSSYKIADLLKKYLNFRTICLNSNISSGENLDLYYQILEDAYDIVVTTSVGALWPYQNVGTIIMIDEESENYLSDQSPRYDLRKVMSYRANNFKARMVFISTSPSMDTFTKAIQNEYSLLDYRNFNEKDDVNIIVSDLNNEFKLGNYSPLSIDLQKAIKNNLEKKEPILLILNNKGTSDFVICRECGNVEKCQKCHISYKYRAKDDKLVCPACGSTIKFSHTCSNCGSNKIKYMGLGIEKLKKHLEEMYENIRIKVIDEPKYVAFKKTIEEVDKNEIDLIIATNTYARGLSTTKITLIGVMSLDLILKAPGYKSHHLAYSMLTNLKKIIDRPNEKTKMIIQTYDPKNSVIKNFIIGDYYNYYKEEISYRHLLNANPFYEINRILVKGDYNIIYKKAYEIRNSMTKYENTIVIGPSYNYTEKGVQLIIKTKSSQINDFYQKLYSESQQTKNNYTIIIDINPRSII